MGLDYPFMTGEEEERQQEVLIEREENKPKISVWQMIRLILWKAKRKG